MIFFLVSLFNINTNNKITSERFNKKGNTYSNKNKQIDKKPINIVKNHIFTVSHNKSPNIVVYQANIKTNGSLNVEKPVDVFWLFNNKGKITEELSYIEWKLAFGFKLITLTKGKKYKMNLNAIKNKTITIIKEKNKVKSYIIINGKTALLKNVFFYYVESFYLPKVKYLEFRGIDLKTGRIIKEKLIVDK